MSKVLRVACFTLVLANTIFCFFILGILSAFLGVYSRVELFSTVILAASWINFVVGILLCFHIMGLFKNMWEETKEYFGEFKKLVEKKDA